MSITVNNSQELVTALKSAQGGETIELASGNYTPISLWNLNFSKDVTVTSKDPNAEAVMSSLAVSNSSGLVFKNLEWAVDPTTPEHHWKFGVYNSSNITFDNLNVHGSLDNDPSNDRYGLRVRDSENVTVKNSEFQELQYAVDLIDSEHVTVTNNNFHDLHQDGVHGGGNSNLTISKNTFTDFHTGVGHSDAIQLWTSGTTTSAHDITISDNVVMRGAGDPIQGIFVTDQIGNLPYVNLTISGNLIVGSNYNGIVVSNVEGLKLSDNVVAGLPDRNAWIRVIDGKDVHLTGNQATQISLNDVENYTQVGDRTITAPLDGGTQLLNAWVLSHSDVLPAMVGANKIAFAATATVNAIEAVRMDTVTVNGTAGAERLTVNMTRNTLVDGGAGADTITSGGIGHNTLVGGAGDDTYHVRSLFDTIVERAGGGTDSVYSSVDYELSSDVENLRLQDDAEIGIGNGVANKIIGNANANELFGMGGDDALQGLDGDDRLLGGDGADTLIGGAGADTLFGDAGSDQLTGNEGADRIIGGDGADIIEGGAGSDTLIGGAGADLFRFRDGDLGATPSTADQIIDFSSAQGDRIALNLIDANTLVANNQGFRFIGSSEFHRVAGELRHAVSGNDLVVTGDTNGDGQADFMLLLKGAQSISAADFIL